MQEPELNAAENEGKKPEDGKPEKGKKRSLKKIFLYIVLIFIILLGGGYGVLRYIYNDNYIRGLAEEQISAAIDGECTIAELEVSVLGSVQIKGLSLKPAASATDKQFLSIEDFTVKLNVLKSITSFRPDIAIDISNTAIDIERVLSADNTAVQVNSEDLTLNESNSGDGAEKEQYSTNIHDILRSLAEFDWKEKLKELKFWRIATVAVRVSNTTVRVHDQKKKLGECNFTVDFSAGLDDRAAEVKLTINEITPNISDGRIDLAADIVFDWDAAAQRSDKPLAFIGKLDFSTIINNFDLEYIGRYYIQSQDQLLRLDSPLSGKIILTAEDLAQVQLGVDISLARALKLVRNNEVLDGGAPDFKLQVNGTADLSREWSTINNLTLGIKSNNIETGKELINISSKINGSFGSEIFVIFDSKIEAGNILASTIGHLAEVKQGIEGGLTLGAEFVWKRAADWDYNVKLASDRLVIVNKGISAPAPVEVGVTGAVKTADAFQPESVSAEVKVVSAGIEIKTVEPVVIPLQAGKFISGGQADLYINIPQVFEVFAQPLAVLGLQKINEIVEAKVSVDGQKHISLTGMIKNTENKYPPCTLNASFTPAADNKFSAEAEVFAENKTVQIITRAEGAVAEDNMQIDVTNQLALRTQSAMNLGRRFAALSIGSKFPEFPVSGVIRGGTKGQIVKSQGKTSLKIANSLTLNDIVFTTADGKKFSEKNGNFSATLNIADVSGAQILSLKNLVLKSDSLTVSAEAAQVNIAAMSANTLEGLNTLKDAQITVDIQPAGFKNLGALLDSSTAAWVNNGRLFRLAVKTPGNGTIAVSEFNLQSEGLTASIDKLAVSPGKILTGIKNKDYNTLLAGVSPFSLFINSTNAFWQNINLPEGLDFRGKAEVAIDYEPSAQRVNIQKIILAGDKTNKAFITRLSAATVIEQLDKLIANQELPQIINSLSKGVNIPVVTLSVPRLKNYLAGLGSNVELSGSSIELQNIRLLKAKNGNGFQLYGNLAASNLALGNMLKFNGSILLNNLIALKSDGVDVTGEIKLDKAGLYYKATPYVYKKPLGTATKLYYKFNSSNNGALEVAQAGMTGGPVVFGLKDFKYAPQADGKFSLSLPVFRVSAPIGLSISNVQINPQSDLVQAQVTSPGIDLTALSSQLDLGFPSRLSGNIGGLNLLVNDKYSTLVEQAGKRMSAQNKFVLAPSRIRLDSADSTVTMQLAVGKVGGDSGSGKFAVDGITITSPTGFADNTPVQIGRIESVVDMDSVFSKPFVITDVIIGSFKAVYEMKAQGNNLQVLQQNIDRLLPASKDTTASAPAVNISAESTPSAAAGDAKSGGVLIRNLYLNNGVVNLQTPILKGNFDIAPVHIKDLGGDNPRLAFTTILQVLVKSIGTSAVSFLKDNPAKAVESVTNIIGDVLKKTNKDVEKNDSSGSKDNQDVGKQINEGVKALQGLFGR